MKKEYDFSASAPNPYAQKARKKQISINLNVETIEYFKAMANKQGVSYQALINIFLNQCARAGSENLSVNFGRKFSQNSQNLENKNAKNQKIQSKTAQNEQILFKNPLELIASVL